MSLGAPSVPHLSIQLRRGRGQELPIWYGTLDGCTVESVTHIHPQQMQACVTWYDPSDSMVRTNTLNINNVRIDGKDEEPPSISLCPLCEKTHDKNSCVCFHCGHSVCEKLENYQAHFIFCIQCAKQACENTSISCVDCDKPLCEKCKPQDLVEGDSRKWGNAKILTAPSGVFWCYSCDEIHCANCALSQSCHYCGRVKCSRCACVVCDSDSKT